MYYINFDELQNALNDYKEYCGLLTEYGCEDSFLDKEYEKIFENVKATLQSVKNKTAELSESDKEPDLYEKIVAVSPGGNCNMPVTDLNEKIKGAMVARFAGCILGAIVENWSVENMKKRLSMRVWTFRLKNIGNKQMTPGVINILLKERALLSHS